jgi:hypothetical protein
VETGYELGMSLGDLGKRTMRVEGEDLNSVTSRSLMAEAFLAEAKSGSEALDVAGWECCKASEEVVVVEPKAQWPGAGWEFWRRVGN